MSHARMLTKPLFGGPFGSLGTYALATMPTVANGLHGVRWMVIQARLGTVLAVADDKLAAIVLARRFLGADGERNAANDRRWNQTTLFPELMEQVAESPKVRPISRRRRQIFERSGGSCHYCRRALTLDGTWHVEHMHPRALGGDDRATNLVAACAPCNLAKGPRTSLEFLTLSTSAE